MFAAPDLGEDLGSLRARLPMSAPPIVFLKSEPSRAFTTILIDNYGGARPRPRISSPSGADGSATSRARSVGTRRATDSRVGATRFAMPGSSWVRRGRRLDRGERRPAIDDLRAADPAMDAVFVANDQMALGAMHRMLSQGVRIPDDIAVVGFDGMDEGAYFSPALTTVRQPLGELGQLAVREVLAADPDGHGPSTRARSDACDRARHSRERPAGDRRREARGRGGTAPLAAASTQACGASDDRRVTGSTLRFGLFLSQASKSLGQVQDEFGIAEELGFDTAYLVDHLVDTDGPPEQPCLESWTLLAGLAA